MTKWTTQPTAILSTALGIYLGYRALQHIHKVRQLALEPSPMHPLLKNNIHFVNIRGKTLRIVHIPHSLGSNVPLVVFIHGVGGQFEQFEKQIVAIRANILAIDMCGYGGSSVPDRYEDYTTESYVEDLVELLQQYQSDDTVLVCHSYGCAIGTMLSQRLKKDSVKGLVLICPKALITPHEQQSKAKLVRTPNWIVDLARKVDRMGGTHSQSVNRLLHASANEDLRRKQLQWNKESRTTVLKRLMAGVHYPTQQDFCKIECPLLIIVGEDDRVCPPVNAEQIFKWRQDAKLNTQAPFIIPRSGHQTMLEKWELVNPIINTFFIKECGLSTIDQAWQLTLESQKENKWSLKNLEKWQKTPIISSPIGRGVGKFRAMKVLRQTDLQHSPSAFLAQHKEVGFIVDISLDAPPYQTTDFEGTFVTYSKVPTVSKIPPSREDVQRFIDHCKTCWQQKPGVDIAVHCHYGFNRTGFMICSFLIEEQNYTVAEALTHFHDARPPKGIRHEHFKGELYLRYEAPPQWNILEHHE
ncbi:hypothetical protein BG004_006045 [Podila humilis]|nr:hypothetical protein BG004_006045 [Podila humilis]